MVRTPRTSRALLPSLAIAAACAAAAATARADDDWVVRPVRLGTAPFGAVNVDVLVRGDDGVSVGYTLTGDPNLYLSTLPAAQPYFQHLSSNHGYLAASFAASGDGAVSYAGGVGNGIRVGQDSGGWGLGLLDSAPPASSSLGTRTRLPSVAVDSHGIPAFVAADTAGQRVFSRYDVPSASWQSQTLPSSATSLVPFFQSALAYTPDDRAVVAYVNNAGTLVVDVQSDAFAWQSFNPATLATATRGVSVATAPDGRIGVAFAGGDGVHVATFDGISWTNDRVSAAPANLELHSLAVDATGQFALAYAPSFTASTAVPLHLTTLRADGTWSDQTLPLSAIHASLAFDAANHPYVGAFDGSNVLLAGTTVPALLANDFTLDGTVSAADVPAFAQAVRHPFTYLSAHAPPLSTTADLVSIGNHNADVRLTDADARAFVESLTASPVPGLADRTAGFRAFDDADLDPNVGSGTGNFFATTLSTGHPYSPGASRADLTGPTLGAADARIDAADVNYLHAALLAASHGAPFDPRLDLNGDGTADADDLRTLVYDILGTIAGDATVDGRINADDYALVDRGFNRFGSDWTDGDFNLDGLVNADDYARLDLAFAENGGSLSPALLSLRQSQFGDAYVQSLLASIPEPSSLVCLLAWLTFASHRRTRSHRRPYPSPVSSLAEPVATV